MYTQSMENKTNRWWDILAFGLLLLALWTTAFRLEVTHWTENINRVDFLVTVGYLLGVLLGLSVFTRKAVFWMSAAYSLFFITWQVGASIPGDYAWYYRLTLALHRIWVSTTAFFQNHPNSDTLLFLALMGSLFWFIGLSAGYMLTRHNRPWIPLIAAGLTLFIVDFNNFFLPNRYSYSGAFVLFALLLIGRVYYLRSRREWNETGISIDFETGFSLGRSMIIGGLILVLVAWNLPSALEALTPGTKANDSISSSFSGLKKRISNAVSGLNNPVTFVPNSFSSTMGLGTGAVLNEDVLFTVKPSAPPNSIRYYWRGYSYDTFDGREWKNTIDTTESIAQDQWPLKYPVLVGRRKVTLIYEVKARPNRVAYIPSMLLSLDKPASLVFEKMDDGSLDVISTLANKPLNPGETFQAEAWISAPTITQLKEAGQDYPDWVRKYYLQVPSSFSKRVAQLAKEITAGKETPYDQTVAITEYLRSNITYEKVIPSPPARTDLLEWFLLDYKKGFCNYYATSEVMMLRSIGIPARVAVGYAQGQYDDVKADFTVRASDSHAWPEVYFPGTGWVEFEPTSAQPPISLVVGSTLNNSGNQSNYQPAIPQDLQGESGSDRFNRVENVDVPNPGVTASKFNWAIFPVALLVFAGLLWLWLLKHPDWLRRPLPFMLEEVIQKRGLTPPGILRYWSRQLRLKPVERMFEQVSWMLWLLGIKGSSGQTPAEQMAMLVKRVPAASDPALVLLTEYHQAEYSLRTYDLTAARNAYVDVWRFVLSSFTRRFLNVSPS